ncbi:MAG TPA: response regulator, partial [Dongiaceae bacterium]|nr:response regulator [Dongiaceae bacterium]
MGGRPEVTPALTNGNVPAGRDSWNLAGNESGLVSAQESMGRLTASFKLFRASNRRDERLKFLREMQQEVEAVRAIFLSANFLLWGAFSYSLSALLQASANGPGYLTPSAYRTICGALDLLRKVLVPGSGLEVLIPESRWRGAVAAPITAMVVDDDLICGRALDMAMRRHDMKTKVCEGAPEALRQLRDTQFDVIFSDIMMPGMDGFAFSTEVRKLPNHRLTPVILVTSLSDLETRSRSVLIGCCDFIAKPISPSEVAVKAFAFGLKHRMEAMGDACPPQEAPLVPDQPTAPAPRNATSHGVIQLDHQGRVKSANQRCCDLLGYAGQEVVGCLFQALFPADLQAEETGKTVGQLLAGKSADLPAIALTARCKDGSGIKLSVHLRNFTRDGVRTVVGLLSAAAESEAGNSCGAPPPSAALEAAVRPPQEPLAAAGDVDAAEARAAQSQVEPTPRRDDLDDPGESPAALQAVISALEDELRAKHLSIGQEQARRQDLERQIQQLTARRVELEQEIAERQRVAQEAQRRGTELAEAQARLEQDLAARILEARQAQERAAELEKTQQSRSAELEGALEREAQLKQQCAALDQQLGSLNQALAQSRQELVQENQRRLSAEEQAGQLGQARTELERELDQRKQAEASLQHDLESVRAQMQAHLDRLESELEQGKRQAEQTRRSATELAEAQARLEQELAARTRQAQEAQERTAELERTLQQLTARRVELEKEIEERQRGAQEAQGRGTEVAEARARLEQELDQRRQAEARLEHDLESVQAQMQAHLETLASEQEKLRTTTARLEAAEAQTGSLQQQHAALTAELAESHQGQAELRDGHLALEEELRARRLFVEQEQARRQDLEREIQELTARRVELEQEIEKRKGEAQEAQRRGTEVAEARARLEQELDQRRQAEARLEHDLESVQAQMQAHLETLASEQEKLRTTTARLEAAEAQTGSLQQQHAALTAELAESHQSQAGLRDGHRALEEELRARRLFVEQEQARRQDLKRQIQRLTARQVGLEKEMEE